MKKMTVLTMAFLMVAFLSANVSAYTFLPDTYDNITISDENDKDANWYRDQEDQEVEPGMVRSQSWDMEAFVWDESASSLSMIGGYDFDTTGYSGTVSGDIFIDVDGDAIFGDFHEQETEKNMVVEDTYGYDYVLDMDFTDFTYDVYALGENSRTQTAYYKQNQGSNPWRYYDGGTLLAEDISFGYTEGMTDAEVGYGLTGGSHNMVAGLDLSLLSTDIPLDFYVHFTMQCGNDNLMGEGTLAAMASPEDPTATPEPATMLLLGFGLVGLATLRKRFAKN